TTEAPTQDAATEAPTEETPTEDITTEAPTEDVTTEAPTEDVTTEAPTEVPTEKPTETPTEKPTETSTETPTEPEPEETVDPLREDYDMNANDKAVEFGAAGYPGKVIQLMNYDNGVLLGDFDLSLYAAMIVVYGSDSGAMLGDVGSQVVLTANGSVSKNDNSPREDAVILASAPLSNPTAGWYRGDREAVITLDTDYSGPVYICHKMASSDGIAVSAIILVKKDPADLPSDPTDPTVFENRVGESFQSDFSFDQSSSINIWFWADSFSNGFNALFAKGTKDTGRHFEVYAEVGNLKLYAPAANGGNPISLNLNLNNYTGQWHMLTLVHDGGQLRVYMDAVHLYTATIDFTIETGEDPLFIGQIVEGGMEFIGSIGVLDLQDAVMTDDQIVKAYTSVMGKLPETGNDTPTLSGNDVGTSFQSDFDFGDGTSINLWVNAKSFGDFGILLAKSTKNTNRHFEIYCQGSRVLFYAPAANGNNPIDLNLDLADCVGGWHMLTLVHTEGQIKVYLDGTLCHTADGNFALEAGEDTCYYGQLVESGFVFNGQIVQGELLNEALTDDAVASRYQAVMG
ncbi:MAG: hypothetical protein IKU90_05640, partial [Clostridia bacterium]|nr:hypothetical protein [Clostridia bacterium]